VLGEVLQAAGAITAPQLEHALAEQRVTGALLGETLVALTFITEETLASALAQQAGVPFMTLTNEQPDPAALALVPEPFARKHTLAPLEVKGAVLRIAQANPFDVVALDDLRRLTSHRVAATCAPAGQVRDLLDRCYGRRGRGGVLSRPFAEPAVVSAAQAAEATQLLDRLVGDAVANQATELHFEPGGEFAAVRYRIDGVLVPGDAVPTPRFVSFRSHIKALSGLDVTDTRAAQYGRTSHVVNGRRIDLLVNTIPGLSGETMAIRLLDKGKTPRRLPELGLSRRDLRVVRGLLDRPQGLAIVSGPEASGTSTTLYAMLAHVAGESRNVVTLENPIECQVSGIRQTQIRPQAGFTYATAMRFVLRENPDVLMIGEMPDSDTADMAMKAALSGVLVLTTFRTADAASAVLRLADLGLDSYAVASGLLGVIGQRLIRLICRECTERVSYGDEMVEQFGLTPDPDLVFQRGRGCVHCRGTGYRGRMGAFETLVVDAAMQVLIRSHADAMQLTAASVDVGMKTLRDDALAKAILQQTTLEEVLRIAGIGKKESGIGH
jgi:type IV pilus assembly protein PilB